MSSEQEQSRHNLPSTKVSILPGAAPDLSAATFVIVDEDHTMGNLLRHIIMKNPKVEFCGYTAPHPSEPKIHLRIQMYDGQNCIEALRKGLDDMEAMIDAVDKKYQDELKVAYPEEYKKQEEQIAIKPPNAA